MPRLSDTRLTSENTTENTAGMDSNPHVQINSSLLTNPPTERNHEAADCVR